jgi:hypothetical protein
MAPDAIDRSITGLGVEERFLPRRPFPPDFQAALMMLPVAFATTKIRVRSATVIVDKTQNAERYSLYA